MQSLLKKTKIIAITLSIAVASGVFSPKQSHAIVAVASWNPILMGAGLALGSGGYLVGASGEYLIISSDKSKARKTAGHVIFGIGAAAAMIGMIILEDQSTSLEFRIIDNQTQRDLGLNDAEVAQFNKEIDQVNLLSYQVAHELGQSTEMTPEIASRVWQKYSDIVSPITFKTMGKISAAVFNK